MSTPRTQSVSLVGPSSIRKCDSSTYTVRFLKNSRLSHIQSVHNTDSTPCPWSMVGPDGDEYIPDTDVDAPGVGLIGSISPTPDVQEALHDQGRLMQSLSTRIDHLQAIHNPVTTSVQVAWFRDLAFRTLVSELHKPPASLGRRLHLPGTLKRQPEEPPFHGLLRTYVSVYIPCPFSIYADMMKSHSQESESKTHDNPVFYPSFQSFLLPCNSKHRYVVGFSSFFGICSALAQLDTSVTSAFLIKEHNQSQITRVLGSMVRSNTSQHSPLYILPGYSWDGVLPDPNAENPTAPAYVVRSLRLASTVVNSNMKFRNRFTRSIWPVS